MQQFEVSLDKYGNIWIASGWVYQISSQVLSESGSDAGVAVSGAGGSSPSNGMPPTTPRTATFIGGSGRLLKATPSDALSNPAAKTDVLGIYLPQWADEFQHYEHPATSLFFTSATAAEISDGTGTVAEWATGDDAPLGVYAATTYGKDTYNSGAAFDITITEETAGGRLPGDADVSFSAGTAQAGWYEATGMQGFSNIDPDWTITINGSGVAEIKCAGVAVATRTTTDAWDDPTGDYTSTSYGATTYNGGVAFTARVSQRSLYPVTGYAIVQCNMSAADLVTVSKPFFAASIPASTSTELYLPVFKSNGSTQAQQLHLGMIIIP